MDFAHDGIPQVPLNGFDTFFVEEVAKGVATLCEEVMSVSNKRDVHLISLCTRFPECQIVRFLLQKSVRMWH
jgi:hypothetical protein